MSKRELVVIGLGGWAVWLPTAMILPGGIQTGEDRSLDQSGVHLPLRFLARRTQIPFKLLLVRLGRQRWVAHFFLLR